MDTLEDPAVSGDEVYLRYVSPLLEARLRDLRPVVVPEVTRTRGSVALIDVERFSAFAERMAARGNDGVEKLADRINATFAVLVEAIDRYGGIAHAFPGDSVVAFWPAEARSMEECALLASRCCLELLEIHRDDELPLKAGLSAGEFSVAHLGGVQGRLQLLLSGPALDEMGRAEERSSRGRLIVAAPAWNLLSAHAAAAVESDGFHEIKTLRAAAAQAAVVSTDGPGPAAVNVQAARAYLPAALLRQLDAGHRSWLGEFREVTTTFIQIRTGQGPDTDMAKVQNAFASVQAAVFRRGGEITRFAHDDKGLAVLAVFGLPPASGEDSATRAVEASLEIERDARRDAWSCRIGVATGRVFCGTLGAPRRREFSVVGSTPNLAARLMLSLDGGVLCDAATRSASTCTFESAGRLQPRGFPEAQEVFRPSSVAEGSAASERLQAADGLVGREVELPLLEGWMERLREDGVGSVMVVEGEAGIGKTTLVRQSLETARAGGAEVLVVPCRAAESTAGYAAWGRALPGLLRLDRHAGVEERAALLEGTLAAAGVNAQLAPLVGPVVGIPIEDNAVTFAMSGAARADNLLAVLARLVSWSAARRRELGGTLVVVFEDVHEMDPASWDLVGVLGRNRGPTSLGLLLTLRSQTLAGQGDAEAILATLRAERVVLGAFTPAQTREFACRLLQARELDSHLAEITFQRTRGNPFFCEQLLLALVESGIVGVENGTARFRGRNPEEAEALVPRTVAAVLTSRLDRLPAPMLLTLKVASVVGASFFVSLLTAVHPMRHDRDTVLAHLAAAADAGLVEADRDDASVHRFRHALTGDVAYDLLLASQQRRLHREVAEAIAASEDFPAARSVLFHHWRRSGEEARALRHVDQAGAEAMRNGNYHAVVEMYGYALKTLASAPAGAGEQEAADRVPRAARWAAHLGQAQVAIGLHDKARPNLERCLTAIGEWVPASTPALATATAAQAGRQLLHRLRPCRFEGARAAEAEVLSLAADTYEQLGFIHYSAGQTFRGVHAALRILNLAELAGRRDLLARSHATMSLTMSVIGRRELAEAYDRRAMRLARDSDDARTQAYVGWVTGMRAVGEARWELAAVRTEAAQKIAEAAGDLRLNVMCLQVMAWVPYVRGESARAAELAEAQLAIARASSNRLWEVWALNGLAETAATAGDHAQVARHCRRALEVLTEESDRNEEIRALGLLAAARRADGRPDDAVDCARRALELVATTQITSYVIYSGVCGAVDAVLGTAEDGRDRGATTPPALRRDMKRAAAALSRFAGTFAMGRPRLQVVQARLAAFDGSLKKARRHFDLALRAAHECEMPHEKILALLAAARSEAFDPAARLRLVNEALHGVQGGVAREQALKLLAGLEGAGA